MRSDLSILYVGAASGTSGQRASALERLGHRVTRISPYAALSRHWRLWLARTGGAGVDTRVARHLGEWIPGGRYDLAFVDSGEVLGPRALTVLRSRAPLVLNYNADNPYLDPPPERGRWCLLRAALPFYDLCVSFRRPGQEAAMVKAGVRTPYLAWLSADEVAHRALRSIPEADRAKVLFAGTWMPGRGRFLRALLDFGVPLTIDGPRWDKAPERTDLAGVLRHGYLDDAAYARAIAGADVALVMLNPANNDHHTSRSAEIPAIGTAMVAPRTDAHQALYHEGVEAMFFESAEECAACCHGLLSDAAARRRLAAAGHRRVAENGMYNQPLLSGILEAALSLSTKGKAYVAG